MPAGRPSTRTKEIEDAILDGIASGIPLTKICRRAGMPNPSTVFDWCKKDTELDDKVTRAREMSADYYSYEIKEISDEKPTMQIPDPDGGVSTRIDPAGIQRNRLRIDTRIKLMQMLKRKTYGDKTAITGEDGGPVELVVRHIGSGGE